MSVCNYNDNRTPHERLIEILFNTPETPEQKKAKKELMKLRIKYYNLQKEIYLDNQYKILELNDRKYINHLLEEYNYIPKKYNYKKDFVITIEDMLSGVFT
jgi:hypothetical protein